MMRKMKYVALAGALAGLVGAFLPMVNASIGRLSLGASLWDISQGRNGAIGWAVLIAFALAAALAAWGLRKRFGRGVAAGTLLVALPALGLPAVWFVTALQKSSAGVGLWMLFGGGLALFAAAVMALIKPEAAKPVAVG